MALSKIHLLITINLLYNSYSAGKYYPIYSKSKFLQTKSTTNVFFLSTTLTTPIDSYRPRSKNKAVFTQHSTNTKIGSVRTATQNTTNCIQYCLTAIRTVTILHFHFSCRNKIVFFISTY